MFIPVILFGIAFLGMGLNKLCIYANDGKMPVKIAWGYTAAEVEATGGIYEPMTEETKLKVLGDVIYVDLDNPYQWTIISVGDVLISVYLKLKWFAVAIGIGAAIASIPLIIIQDRRENGNKDIEREGEGQGLPAVGGGEDQQAS